MLEKDEEELVDYIQEIINFKPANEQERSDQRVILDYALKFPHNILLRENEVAHITSSSLIINEKLDKVLMIHHNIRDTWAWTGGHADGDGNLLEVSIREAREETGIVTVHPLSKKIVSIDILPVYGHLKRDLYVSAHLHLSIAYLLVASENDELAIKYDENSDVRWFPLSDFTEEYFSKRDVYLYGKFIDRAKKAAARM